MYRCIYTRTYFSIEPIAKDPIRPWCIHQCAIGFEEQPRLVVLPFAATWLFRPTQAQGLTIRFPQSFRGSPTGFTKHVVSVRHKHVSYKAELSELLARARKIYKHLSIFLSFYLYLCIYLSIYLSIYRSVDLCTHGHLHSHTYINRYTNTCVHAYIHRHTCTHMSHMYVYPHTCLIMSLRIQMHHMYTQHPEPSLETRNCAAASKESSASETTVLDFLKAARAGEAATVESMLQSRHDPNQAGGVSNPVPGPPKFPK